MVKLTIVWTDTALKQRNVVFNYWNERNKSNQYSKKLKSAITLRTNQLIEFPELGKKVDFKNTRVISLGHFNIFYQELNNKIIITAFWDNRNDTDRLLQLLK